MAPIIKEANEIEEARAIMPQVSRIYNTLDSFKVNSPATWLEAGDKIKAVKEKVKEIKRIRSSILDPINTAKENTMVFFEPAITKCEAIIDTLGKRMANWRLEQEEKERIAREKAEAEAREKERLEKERLRKEAEAKEAEARRIREEAKRKQKEAEGLAKKEKFEKSEKARFEAEKFTAEVERLQNEAKELKDEAKEVVVEAKEVKSRAGKIDDLHFRRYWKAEIIDEKKLPREFLKPDEVTINKYVTEHKEDARIPGVRIYFEDIPING
jgi:chromosome segregation ATPase